MPTRSLLVISFYFPPFSRVGGRRWAKHLKFLQNEFNDFHVLAGDFEEKGTQWLGDITGFADRITRVPVKIKYPYYKRILPANLSEKLKWKLSYWKWKQLSKNKEPEFWDDSYGYERVFLKEAEKLIRERNISTVLLSIGPFEIANIIPPLKKKFPHLRIILDYRDYWNDPNTGMDKINLKLTQREKEVLQYVNAVMTVNKEMANHFEKKLQKRAVLLPHCIDPSDFHFLDREKTNTPSDLIRLVYGGALYADMHKQLKDFTDFVNLLSHKKNVHAEIFAAQKGYEELLHKQNIHLGKYLPLEKYYSVVNDSDYILLFRPDWSPNAFSSKFYELLHFRKPILYFGPNGDVADLISSNRLGLHITSSNIADAVGIVKDHAFQFNKDYDLKQHEFSNYNNLLLKELANG